MLPLSLVQRIKSAGQWQELEGVKERTRGWKSRGQGRDASATACKQAL